MGIGKPANPTETLLAKHAPFDIMGFLPFYTACAAMRELSTRFFQDWVVRSISFSFNFLGSALVEVMVGYKPLRPNSLIPTAQGKKPHPKP